MALKSGTRLGPYDIVAPLGVGGMGEVYRAHDARLGRDVALKILPENLASDPDRMNRFAREARMLAALNHPNIAAIHGLEESGAHRALVMELVEGPTIAEIIARGPLPIEEALPIARLIAEGLEYAHEHGIVHRDLKPSNIKLRPDGVAKILDFGLARSLHMDAAADMSHSPTITMPLTRSGVVLGTAAYMSPEQARGKVVDRRADIWAFGCVLYEMITGRPAFQRETTSDTVAAVLGAEPGWDALPAETSPRLRNLLRRCMTKDPKQRVHDIADARLEIEDVIASGASGTGTEGRAELASMAVTRRRAITGMVLGVVLAALVAIVWVLSGIWPGERAHETRPLQLSIVSSEGRDVESPAISPDGRRVAYRARRTDGMPLLWVRDLDTFKARPLAGTEGASNPFWSPDSRYLGFFAGGAMKRIPAEGGPVQFIASSPQWSGGGWAPDGTILFSPESLHLSRVSAAGGATEPATTLPGRDWTHMSPSFLPDGRRFLFTAKLWTRLTESSEQGIYLGSLDSPEVRYLLPDLSSAVYAAPGYVVFVRDGALMAVPFDLDAGQLAGEPRPLGVAAGIDNGDLSAVSVAADGTLAVRPPACALEPCDEELRLVDRGGRVVSTGPRRSYGFRMALAPDGQRVAAQIGDRRTGTNDLWLVSLNSTTVAALTTTRGSTVSPVWSPDGVRLAYAYEPPDQADDVYIKDFGSGAIEPVIENPTVFEHPLAWSHDGAHLLVYRWGEQPSGLFEWSFDSRKLTPFVTSAAFEGACFSPDDRYVAFSSAESGREEVYVTTFPERRQTWTLTSDGGTVLSWRADGREILVATLSGHILAYPVSTQGGFTAEQPAILIRDVGTEVRYSSATPDHSHILIRVNPDAAKDKGEIRLLFNWAEGLEPEPQ